MVNITGKKILIAVIVILCVGGGIFGIYSYDRYKTLYHFQSVVDAKVYRSGCLSLEGLKKAHEISGFKTIINLRSEAERTNKKDKRYGWYTVEKNFASDNKINLVDIPMLTDTPPSPEQIKYFLEVATNPENQPVLIHCEAGAIRTGMMVAIYRIAVLREKNEDVLKNLPMFGHDFEGRQQVKDFILNFGKDNAVKK